MITYQALFEPAEEGGFVITFPGLDFGATQGEDERDGMEMAVDFLEIALSDLIEKGEPLPVAKKYRGKKYHTVSLPAVASAKAQLYREFLASRIRKAELARRLGIPKTNIERLFNFEHSTHCRTHGEVTVNLSPPRSGGFFDGWG